MKMDIIKSGCFNESEINALIYGTVLIILWSTNISFIQTNSIALMSVSFSSMDGKIFRDYE